MLEEQRRDHSDLPVAQRSDGLGNVESHGIDFIPEEHRYSRPSNVAWIIIGSCFTFPLLVVGALPIVLGLSWWATFWAVLSGTFFGSLLLAPMALLSPQTGTNNPMGSAAHFGVVGRVVGSIVGLLVSVLFTALAIWSGGDAIATSLTRLLSAPDGTFVRLIWYTVLAISIVAVAVYGHATMLFLQKYVAWLCGGAMAIGVIVFADDFSVSYEGGSLALGSFWPTWFAAFGTCVMLVVGYSLAIGDWTRYISPHKHSNSRIVGATVVGSVVGMGVPLLWGAATATLFADPAADYVATLVGTSPLWYVPFLLLLGVGSGCAQGTVNMYSTGLDISSMVPSVGRIPGTLFVGASAYVLVIYGTWTESVIVNLTAFLDVLNVGFVSFVGVVMIGYWNHRGAYDADALQVVVRGERGGRYWYAGGWNWRAATAFAVATVIGLLGVTNAWIHGPLVEFMGGAGLGFLLSLVVGPFCYLCFLLASPEPAVVYAAGKPRIARRLADKSSG